MDNSAQYALGRSDASKCTDNDTRKSMIEVAQRYLNCDSYWQGVYDELTK